MRLRATFARLNNHKKGNIFKKEWRKIIIFCIISFHTIIKRNASSK